MFTDATGADVRTPTNSAPSARAADLERQLHEARTEARLLRVQTALRRLKESAALDYDWYGPWSEVQRQRDGDRAWVPVGGTHARQHGHYFPFFQNETQLATLRDLSRVVVGTNNHAAGMLNGLTSFVIGTGFKTKVTPTDGDKALAQRVTDWLDEWAAANCWEEFQQEAFSRHREDGDELIRMFPDDGCLKVRHVWPEQLTQPPGTGTEWLYGVRMPAGDTAAPEAEEYAIADIDDPADIEIVPADEIVHFKANTRTGVKRGLPDFSFGTKDALDAAGRLTRNLGEGAAIREAIAFMRQHAAATEADVTAFTSADSDFKERDPARESYRPVNIWAPGTVVDFPEGMEHAGAPANPGTAAHASVVQILLRSAGVRWNAPEWLVSGDASNMGAYTSSLVAESPFVLSVRRAQGYYRPRFLRIVRRAVALAVAYGYLPGGALEAVKIDLVPPSPEVRNKLEEAQRAQTEITLGVDSRQRYCEEQGRDWERIAKENQEYEDQFGAPGDELPLGDDSGAGADAGTPPDQPPEVPPDGPTALDGTPLPESESTAAESHRDLFEQIDRLLEEEGGDGPAVRWFRCGGVTYRVDVELLEAAGGKPAPAGKVWKTVTFTRNGKQVKQQRLVNAPKASAGKQKGAAKNPTPKQAAAAKAVTAVSAAQKKLAGGGALTPAALAALPGHLQALTVPQLKQVAGALKVKGAKAKAGTVAALVAHATAQTQSVTAAKAATKGPSKSQQTAAAKVASLNAATAAFATIRAGNALSAADLAALPGHLNNLSSAQLDTFRKLNAKHLTGDKTKAQKVATLAQWASGRSASNAAVNAARQQTAAAQQQAAAAQRAAATSPPPPPPPQPAAQPSAQQAQQGQQRGQSQPPPGGPPRPGLVWDPNSHRWVLPPGGGVFGAFLKAGQKVTSDTGDRMALNALVDRHLVAEGITATDALARGLPSQIAADIRASTDGSVRGFHVERALKQHAALEAKTVIAPLHAVPGGRNGPNSKLPDGTRPGGMTVPQQVALQQYTTEVYGPLNKALRETGTVPPELADLHRDLQGAFANVQDLAKPIAAVRGLKIDPAQLGTFLAGYKPGSTIALGGYQSTTPGTQLDPFFKGNVKLNIAVSRGIDLSPHTHYAGSPAQELLLEHNAQYRVKAVRRSASGVTEIDLEQLPRGGAQQQKPGFWGRLFGRGSTPAPAPAAPAAPSAPTPPLAGNVTGAQIVSNLKALPSVQAVINSPATVASLQANANQWTQGEETVSTAIAKDLGRADPPQLVSRAQMDALESQPGWTVGVRGVKQDAFHDNHRTGPLWTGTGIYGAGIYVAAYTGGGPVAGRLTSTKAGSESTARTFGSSLTRFALPPTAKIGDESAVGREQRADLTKLAAEHSAGKVSDTEYNALRAVMLDAGRYAMLKGYDAIIERGGYMVVLNRKLTTMQNSNYT